MNRRFVVLDLEASICRDCAQAQMCYYLRMINDLYDPLIDIRAVITDCEAYRPWQKQKIKEV